MEGLRQEIERGVAAALAEDEGGFVLAVGPHRRTLEEVFIDAVGEVSVDASDL